MSTDPAAREAILPGAKEFVEHLERAAAIVKTWPEWKQSLLGSPTQPATEQERGEKRPTIKLPPDVTCKWCGESSTNFMANFRVSGDKTSMFWEHRCPDTHAQCGYSRIDPPCPNCKESGHMSRGACGNCGHGGVEPNGEPPPSPPPIVDYMAKRLREECDDQKSPPPETVKQADWLPEGMRPLPPVRCGSGPTFTISTVLRRDSQWRTHVAALESELRKVREVADDLHFAYQNKDKDSPHKFEIDAVAAYKALSPSPKPGAST